MLVSHRHKFIYLKTMKTAGTAVEIFFEEFCVPGGTYTGPVELTPERVSEAGIIGARPRSPEAQWWNHMPAERIKAQLDAIDPAIWTGYFRFACVRDPFDATVSLFWWSLPEERRAELALASAEVRAEFRKWLQGSYAAPMNRDILFMRDGTPAVHAAIRYEHLLEDTRAICDRLGLPFDSAKMRGYKTGFSRSCCPLPTITTKAAPGLWSNATDTMQTVSDIPLRSCPSQRGGK